MEDRQLSGESARIFTEGIGLLLSRWSALQLAVDNEWGGRDSRRKAELLASDVFSFFSNTREPFYIDDLESILEEGLMALNTMAEDGSIEEVAKKLMIMHEECIEGNFQSIERMKMTNPPSRTHLRQVSEEDEDGDGDEDEDEDEDEDPGAMANDSSRTTIRTELPNSHSSSMIIDEKQPNHAAEAEDGWVVVSSKRGKGKRN